MTEEEMKSKIMQAHIDGYNRGYAKREEEIKTLGERCNQLLKDKGDLTDKIADIKANCDLAIEGRDLKIKELEQKLEQTEKALADYQFNYSSIKELERENARLNDTETMLKVLKDCGVIKSWYYNGNYHIGNELPQ